MAQLRPPVRQCAGCRERRPKPSLRRFVRTGPRDWLPDDAKRLQGRGAYLCLSPECLKQVEKNRRYPGLAAAAAEGGLQQGSTIVK